MVLPQKARPSRKSNKARCVIFWSDTKPTPFSSQAGVGLASTLATRVHTSLTQNNEEVKVVQELLRHANSRITLDLYAQAGMPNKRLAQSKLVRMVLNKGEALA
jgi:hypothetical protein